MPQFCHSVLEMEDLRAEDKRKFLGRVFFCKAFEGGEKPIVLHFAKMGMTKRVIEDGIGKWEQSSPMETRPGQGDERPRCPSEEQKHWRGQN